MRLDQLLTRNLRLIEIDATGGTLGSLLFSAGYCNYLAIVQDKRRRRAIAKRHQSLAGCIVVSNSRRVIRQNNADVLILNGWSGLSLTRFRYVRHAQFIALPLKATPLCWLAVMLALMQWMARRLSRPAVGQINPSRSATHGDRKQSATLLVFRVLRRRPHEGVRRFIPHVLGIEAFLRRLQASGIRHAVLRWFENLPMLPPGEDLDLLVEDNRLDAVRAMLEEGPGIQPVDLYSVSGLPGADYRAMPYFPTSIAEELLERAVDHRGLCRVPAAREHFLSLAYHALYHKGTACGLPSGSRQTRSPKCDHNYAVVLKQLARRLNLDVDITLEELDAVLDGHGWRPPHDMLVRLARNNAWLRSMLHQPNAESAADDRLAVFLVRQEALRRGGVERAAGFIESHGFRVLAKHMIEEASCTRVARTIRGGNWGKGPRPLSGGPPVAAIVAYDPAPIMPTRRQRRRFPFVANARLLCKEKIRDEFNKGLPADQHCNVIHSSDNGREALDYLRIVMPGSVEEVLRSINAGGKDRRRAA